MTTALTIPATFLYSDNVTPYLTANLPINRLAAGLGGESRMQQVSGIVKVTSNLATTAGVRFCRIPTNAIVKSVKLGFEKATLTFTSTTATLGLAFSDAPTGVDGTSQINKGAYYSCGAFAATTGAGFDMSSVCLDVMLDVTYKAQLGIQTFTDGYYTMSASHLPIWQALANGGSGGLGATVTPSPLTSDPGGFFDVIMQPTTTFNVTGNFWALCEVNYTCY